MTCRCELGNEVPRLLQRCIKYTIRTTPPLLSVIIGSVTRPTWELVQTFVVSPIGREAHVKRPVSCARSCVPCRKIWCSSQGRHSTHVPDTSHVLVKQLLMMKLLHVLLPVLRKLCTVTSSPFVSQFGLAHLTVEEFIKLNLGDPVCDLVPIFCL